MNMMAAVAGVNQMLQFVQRLAQQRTRKKCHASGNPDSVFMDQAMKKHFNGPTNKGSKTANRKSMVVAQSHLKPPLSGTLEKPDCQKNLRRKLRFRAKDPIGGNLLTTTTATTGLVIMLTLSILRSHSIIGPGQ
jgi:hypothetical protein